MMSQYTFAGLPECGEIAEFSAEIAIIGIPQGTSYSLGVPSQSVKAPMAIWKTAERYSKMPWIKNLIQVGMRGVGNARIEEIDAAIKYGAENENNCIGK